MDRKVNTKSATKFNPGLALIGLSGTGPWRLGVKTTHQFQY